MEGVAKYSFHCLECWVSGRLPPNDHLGSPRVITDALGQIASRRDFMPFGEDLNVGVGNRTGDNGLKYSMPGDNVRQKFTGYQKDNETQLDFAEANERKSSTCAERRLRTLICRPHSRAPWSMGEIRTARRSRRRSAIRRSRRKGEVRNQKLEYRKGVELHSFTPFES